MMKVVLGNGSILAPTVSAVVVLAFDADEFSGPAAEINQASGGLLQKLKAAEDLSVKAGKVTVLHHVPGVSAECVVVVGGGATSQFTAAVAFRCAGAATKRLGDRPRKSVALDFGPLADSVASAAVVGAINGCVGQDLFRGEKNLHAIEELHCWSMNEATVRRAWNLGEAMLLTRELVNLPANYMYPEAFVKRAATVAVSSGLELEVWDELRLRRERCGALLAVSAGSTRPPRLLVMRYAGTKKMAPLALVGKGVTFDSGGLSLKPTESMLSMKCDMAGAATVLGAMQAIAALQLERPVVSVVGLVENMISGNCYKLGDVLTARSGKTIEIHNTDAEGRLVLADALNVALDERPSHIIDLATLTGACLVALGTDICGLMTNDQAWQSQVEAAAERAGELVWPLPMHAHFAEQIQSKVADIKNVGEGRWGGAITAAKFLQEFVGDTPWAHLDIAGPAFYDSAKGFMDAGGTGVMVRTLVELAESGVMA
jgi:leucyl aminopeptidase